jgi:hypothetical protein
MCFSLSYVYSHIYLSLTEANGFKVALFQDLIVINVIIKRNVIIVHRVFQHVWYKDMNMYVHINCSGRLFSMVQFSMVISRYFLMFW